MVDTRNKILGLSEAVEFVRKRDPDGPAARLITGYFDPVVAAHARRLEGLRSGPSPLVVVVTDPPDPILPLRARAELVAALSAADWVVPVPAEQIREALEKLGASVLERCEDEDLRLRQELICHVHTRQRAR